VADRTFTLFHLNLIPRPDPTFETFRGSRDDWLRYALSEPFSFPHWGGATLYWTPVDAIDECILGVLQRTRKHERHRPPEELGGEVIDEEWQGAYVLLDPTHHEEGQRVAIENDVVGEPQALLKYLVESLNSRPDHAYHMEIEPLFDGEEFWEFAEAHDNLLRTITFNFVVPNMWRVYDDLEHDLEDTGKETGAQRVRYGLDSDDGVFAKAPRIRRGIEYTQRGAGTVTAKSLDGDPFSSTSKMRTTRIPAVAFGMVATAAVFLALKERSFNGSATLHHADNDGLVLHVRA
jgi:hypothetical protein